MNIFHKVLNRREFRERPPVLVDVGSSGGLHKTWKILAPYSICLAFDPDDREMGAARRAARDYPELHVFPCALTAEAEDSAAIYLTKAPACSSLVKPNCNKLAASEFA